MYCFNILTNLDNCFHLQLKCRCIRCGWARWLRCSNCNQLKLKLFLDVQWAWQSSAQLGRTYLHCTPHDITFARSGSATRLPPLVLPLILFYIFFLRQIKKDIKFLGYGSANAALPTHLHVKSFALCAFYFNSSSPKPHCHPHPPPRSSATPLADVQRKLVSFAGSGFMLWCCPFLDFFLLSSSLLLCRGGSFVQPPFLCTAHCVWPGRGTRNDFGMAAQGSDKAKKHFLRNI